MFFAATHPHIRRNIYAQNDRSLEQYLEDALKGARQPKSSYTEDETLFTLLLDMPGIAKEQLTIAIDGSAVRVSSKDGATRSYRAAYELPQELDTANSEAKLENGVLTLKLAKKMPVKNVTELVVH